MIKLTAAQCPNCGADIEVNKDLKNSICQYCGSTILVEEAIQKVELTGKVKVEGIHGSSEKISDIKKFMKLKEYTNAINVANDIISKEPFNYEAQALKIKCSIYNFNYDKFDPKSSVYTDKDSWAKVDQIVNTYNRMNAVDEDKIGEKELADVKENLDELIKWHDERVADEEKCKIINKKIDEYVDKFLEARHYNYNEEYSLNELKDRIGLVGFYGGKENKTKAITTCFNDRSIKYKYKAMKFNRDGRFEVLFVSDNKSEFNWLAKADKFDSLDEVIEALDDELTKISGNARKERSEKRHNAADSEAKTMKAQRKDAIGTLIWCLILAGVPGAGAVKLFLSGHNILGWICAIISGYFLLGVWGCLSDIRKFNPKKVYKKLKKEEEEDQ